ncbi:Na+/H+ antiporter NhaC family protein [Agathobaculum sp. NTUH-O15-33]|uniref:Na+/H+ antiporter NhaC family protein n=1 Tax=Agathobaculum sp. NTUH-O15-33 TaxID=3079302 RepID=UPI0029587CBE|nr:Na+/H+ antiporter NhaC family protein [Agathobaculum sp. NTUH-O15-33]WNX85090.1 Na+/H+ antiporter NhaC family protein [Agathobaculum sp. NTUH-O15-33]
MEVLDYGILSLVPPVLAIALALILKNAVFALLAGSVAGFFIMSGFHPIATVTNTMTGVISSFAGRYAAIILMVMALSFGISELIEQSGGSNGFIEYITLKRQIVKSRKGSMFLTWVIGVILYMNCMMSIVLTTLTTRKLNDNFRVSRVKQAYIIRATASPVNGLIPIGQWGGVLLGLLAANGIADSNAMLFAVIPLNFYCIIAVVAILLMIAFDKDFFAMKKAELRAKETGLLHADGYQGEDEDLHVVARKAGASFVFVPTIALLALTFAYMAYSGGGNIIAGDALGGILFSTVVTSIITICMNVFSKNMTMDEAWKAFLKGMSSSMEIEIILVMAVTFGAVVQSIGTGLYLANTFASLITPAILPALVFLIGGIIGYATGTSLGTVSCMMPIAIPWALANGASMPLVIAAAWGAAFFGTQTSPISDETFVTSALVGVDMYQMNKTSLQYNLILFGAAFLLYAVFGFIM